ncbi:Protein piccololike [Caligus rogercresseyi]|uniref:Protein CASC3 n=1 Tax=Caligus rogercresseyi TaxID=217165 RepID=A0A7T8GR64_CALRO|nr:Protein piccololike [Caligus rogercresseyi]
MSIAKEETRPGSLESIGSARSVDEAHRLQEEGEEAGSVPEVISSSRSSSSSSSSREPRPSACPPESSKAPAAVVDDDQDRRNPQYIPKRGVFYEHDDRIDSSEEDEDNEDEWGHDKFAEGDQAPKTKDELVSVYGYDIRNEDTAPRARRRRKYGRGPNKYTRKWEKRGCLR